MKTILTFIVLFLGVYCTAQQTITGRVTDTREAAVGYANIYIEGTYEGTTSDSTGAFRLMTDLTGTQRLAVSAVGFRTSGTVLNLSGRDTTLLIVMDETVNALNEVVITAGVFSASDKKKSATLNSMDIATTASAMGDIYGAYATMPGSQKVGEQGMLFVRGGDSYETKTYMDGMQVLSPYFSRMPDIPTRGRFSPLLFSETVFSTGGYSAEFGQALSSIVDLTTTGLETENKASLSVMSVGASASLARRWEDASLAVSGLYTNSFLHNRLFKQNVDWEKSPSMGDGMMMYRKRIGETGLLKSFCSYNFQFMRLNVDNVEEGHMDEVSLGDQVLFTSTVYSGEINGKWLIITGISYSIDHENILYNGLPVNTNKQAEQGKAVLTWLAGDRVKIRFGGEAFRLDYERTVVPDSVIRFALNDMQLAGFVESELKVTPAIALRLGMRSTNTSIAGELYLSPRISAALKTGQYSQVSLAYGTFRQNPETETLLEAPILESEGASHYILNFQYRKEKRTFRIETYLKQYRDLVKYNTTLYDGRSGYSNEGSGYARGVDLFYRDQELIKTLDFWISYSFLDSQRDYKDFPYAVTPSYASRHNLSMVGKYFFQRLNTYAGITYSFASGRPYDDRNSVDFMAGRTRTYNDLSLNLTYLTSLFNRSCLLHLSVNNLPGFKNVFGYRYSNVPGENGLYTPSPVVPTTGRQAVLVAMISL